MRLAWERVKDEIGMVAVSSRMAYHADDKVFTTYQKTLIGE